MCVFNLVFAYITDCELRENALLIIWCWTKPHINLSIFNPFGFQFLIHIFNSYL